MGSVDKKYFKSKTGASIVIRNNDSNQQDLSCADTIIQNFNAENRKCLIDFVMLS